MQMSNQDCLNFIKEIQKIGLLKRWWIDIFTNIGKTSKNIPIIYRDNIIKYKDLYLKENKTKEELDILLVEVLRSCVDKKYLGLKISIMDYFKEDNPDEAYID